MWIDSFDNFIFIIVPFPLFLHQVETLHEDISFIERVFGIEGAWILQQRILQRRNRIDTTKSFGTLVANGRKKPRSYTDYMNELAPHEMDLLYEVYENDFNVFDYDPCLDI